jgi:hypothetical protein
MEICPSGRLSLKRRGRSFDPAPLLELQEESRRMDTVGPSVTDTRGPSLSLDTTKSTMVLYINLHPRTDRHDGGLVEWLMATHIRRYNNELHDPVIRGIYYK